MSELQGSPSAGQTMGGRDDTASGYADVDESSLEEYWEAFQLFDKDGDGTISTGELKNLLRCFGVDLPDESVKALIDKHDKNEAGQLEFRELVEIMKTITDTQEMDHEIQEVYRLFANDDQGVSAERLMQNMNSLLKLKHEFYSDGENQLADSPDGEANPDIPSGPLHHKP